MGENNMKIIVDLEYASGLVGDLFLPGDQVPDDGFPAVLLIHGGGWTGMLCEGSRISWQRTERTRP